MSKRFEIRTIAQKWMIMDKNVKRKKKNEKEKRKIKNEKTKTKCKRTKQQKYFLIRYKNMEY